jgi:hypothetical protein
MTMRRFGLVVLLLLGLSSVAWGASVRVVVDGKQVATFDEHALGALPQTSVTAATHEEKPSRWDGVALVDILRQAGAPLGKSLRGRGMTKFVRITATDGYEVIFTLAELDPDFGNANVMLADRRDGQALPADIGPYRIVVPGDKRPARWIRQVSTIEWVDGASK